MRPAARNSKWDRGQLWRERSSAKNNCGKVSTSSTLSTNLPEIIANLLLYDLNKFFNADVVAQQIAYDVGKLTSRLFFQQLAQVGTAANHTTI